MGKTKVVAKPKSKDKKSAIFAKKIVIPKSATLNVAKAKKESKKIIKKKNAQEKKVKKESAMLQQKTEEVKKKNDNIKKLLNMLDEDDDSSDNSLDFSAPPVGIPVKANPTPQIHPLLKQQIVAEILVQKEQKKLDEQKAFRDELKFAMDLEESSNNNNKKKNSMMEDDDDDERMEVENEEGTTKKPTMNYSAIADELEHNTADVQEDSKSQLEILDEKQELEVLLKFPNLKNFLRSYPARWLLTQELSKMNGEEKQTLSQPLLDGYYFLGNCIEKKIEEEKQKEELLEKKKLTIKEWNEVRKLKKASNKEKEVPEDEDNREKNKILGWGSFFSGKKISVCRCIQCELKIVLKNMLHPDFQTEKKKVLILVDFDQWGFNQLRFPMSPAQRFLKMRRKDLFFWFFYSNLKRDNIETESNEMETDSATVDGKSFTEKSEFFNKLEENKQLEQKANSVFELYSGNHQRFSPCGFKKQVADLAILRVIGLLHKKLKIILLTHDSSLEAAANMFNKYTKIPNVTPIDTNQNVFTALEKKLNEILK